MTDSPTTVESGAGALAARLAGRYGEDFPTDKVMPTTDNLAAYNAGRAEGRARVEAAAAPRKMELSTPEAAPSRAPISRRVGPSLISRLVGIVPTREQAEELEHDPRVRAALKIASKRPGGPLALLLLLAPPSAFVAVHWLEFQAGIAFLSGPFFQIAYGIVLALLAVGSAFAVAQWPQMDRDGIEVLATDRRQAERGEPA